MKSTLSLTLQGMRVLFFSTLFLASWAVSMSLPHQYGWGRIAMLILMAFSIWGFVDNRRRAKARTQGLKPQVR